MDELVTRALEMFEPVAEERQVTLSSSLSELYVTGNPREMRQLLTNLIDNAIKFTPPGGSVNVSLARDNNQQVRLVVRDTGIGIPAEALNRVFDRFYQVDKSRQRGVETRGNGLGLSICQAIVLAHSGTITVESKLGEGTSFIVKLPLTRSVASISQSQGARPESGLLQ